MSSPVRHMAQAGLTTGSTPGTTEHLATHIMPLDQGPHGYEMFKNKQDGCVRALFQLDR
ncbi:hypothetical protein [Yimella sp. NH-Cas1]|uniref:hypothetical protein n=1 Tax=Yimella sp. NH-Cas1 TaxID=2917726 RepID=UPI001EFB4216|nr:hypothetical protein [Yimella sp. NH-Cas1]MCG8655512.1 hypothetical protein [Yimella sp. NH-Cas1]